MARPSKFGIDYFSHDVDLSDDEKIEYLEAKHGLIGYAVYIKILEKLYRNGYWLSWADRDIMIRANKWGLKKEELIEITNSLLDERLFDRAIYEQHSVLTSRGVQSRYLKACERRKVTKLTQEYWLLEITEDNKNADTLVFVNKNQVNADINPVNANIGTQTETERETERETETEIETSRICSFLEKDSQEWQLAMKVSELIAKRHPHREKTLKDARSMEKTAQMMHEFLHKDCDKKTEKAILYVVKWTLKNEFWGPKFQDPMQLKMLRGDHIQQIDSWLGESDWNEITRLRESTKAKPEEQDTRTPEKRKKDNEQGIAHVKASLIEGRQKRSEEIQSLGENLDGQQDN
jgi:hypothetical protein